MRDNYKCPNCPYTTHVFGLLYLGINIPECPDCEIPLIRIDDLSTIIKVGDSKEEGGSKNGKDT